MRIVSPSVPRNANLAKSAELTVMKTPKEDESLFLDFATQFLGYGSLDAPVWLLGPEAGGGASIAELHRRIKIWAERGRKETEDLQEYHKALELPPKSNWAEKEQATWAALSGSFWRPEVSILARETYCVSRLKRSGSTRATSVYWT